MGWSEDERGEVDILRSSVCWWCLERVCRGNDDPATGFRLMMSLCFRDWMRASKGRYMPSKLFSCNMAL